MDRVDMAAPPPLSPPPCMMHRHRKMMMHMTFFWGNYGEVLFDGWPGTSSAMYALTLLVTFLLAFLVEWLSYSHLIKPGSNHKVAGLVQTVLYGLRIGLAYLIMLAMMSFNGGVFLMGVVGHMVGFLVFWSGVFKKNLASDETTNLPPMSSTHC